MDENMELIENVYKDSEMGVYSSKNLLDLLENKENKITHVLEEELKEYKSFLKESERILIQNKVSPKGSGIMAKMGSDIGTTFETIKDNSDSAIAKMLIQGFTMGTVDMTSKISKFKSTCKKNYLDIAERFLKFQENEIEKLKTFM